MQRSHRLRISAGFIALALVAGACGGDDDSADTSPDTTEAPADSGSDDTVAPDTTEAPDAGDPLLAEATRIRETARNGLVWAANDQGTAAADIIEQTDWIGPDSAPTPVETANVQIIICAPGTACEVAANNAMVAIEALGWTGEIVAAAGTPDSFLTAFDDAMAKDPDAIITMAVPDVAVVPKLIEARERGIVTVSTADTPAATIENGYDAYVSYRMPLMHQVLAYSAIADTEGSANVIIINDSGFPNLVDSVDEYKRVIDQCAGCTSEIVEWQITDALDPTRVDSIISSALAANADANYIVLPYSIGISSVIAAVGQSGRDVRVVTKDGDSVGLQAVVSGGSYENATVSLDWVAYASVDQVVRGLAGEDYIAAEDLGLGVHLYDQTNTPDDAVENLVSIVDYVAKYREIWGLDG